MNASRFLLGTLLMAAAAHQVQAADMSFSGAADGVDPLGHNYSFNGSTFLLSSGSGTFNPLGTLMGPGTVAASFSLALTGPVTFDPTPVGVPDACPPGQYAVYISFNPLTIICIGLATGPVIRHTWQYRMAQPGVITFDSPQGDELLAGSSSFAFTMQFPEAIDPGTFAFSASWSNVSAIPEPTVAYLLLLGLAGLGLVGRFKPAES